MSDIFDQLKANADAVDTAEAAERALLVEAIAKLNAVLSLLANASGLSQEDKDALKALEDRFAAKAADITASNTANPVPAVPTP